MSNKQTEEISTEAPLMTPEQERRGARIIAAILLGFVGLIGGMLMMAAR